HYSANSVSGVILFWNGSPVTWYSRKQATSATSAAEAEVYALSDGLKDLAWLHQLLTDLKLNPKFVVYSDNQPAISIVKNGPTNTTKHLEIKWSSIERILLVTEASVLYCPSELQLADPLTKSLASSRLESGGVLKLLGHPSDLERHQSDRGGPRVDASTGRRI